MTQIELGEERRAVERDRHDGTREVAPDLAYFRTIMVNVVLYGPVGAGDRNWVLIDAGVPGTKSVIKKAAAERFGVDARLAAIILTHGHFDHVGALEDLADEWSCPVYAHTLELPYLTGSASFPWRPHSRRRPDGKPVWVVAYEARGRLLAATATTRGRQHSCDAWMKWLPTPGHSPGHVSFWRLSDKSMIVGDAFITTKAESAYAVALQPTEIHGPPRYFTIDWPAARTSVERLASLAPELLITGHGLAMQGGTMRAALQTLAKYFDRVAIPEEGRYLERPAVASDGSAYLTP